MLDTLKTVGASSRPMCRIDPKSILPCIVEVSAESLANSGLQVVPLDELLEQLRDIKGGNLRLLVKRTSHACGLLSELCARRKTELADER